MRKRAAGLSHGARALGRVTSAIVLGLCAAATPDAATAQSKTGQEQLARRLLDEGIALLHKDDFENACSKLRESMALAPAPGTKVAIARCVSEADRLFALGGELLEKNDFKAACPHFERSMMLDPSAGTQVNIGVCLVRRDGNYSAACLAYQEARRMNRSEKDESRRGQREADISRDLKEIAQHLPKLHVHVPPSPGLLVTVDGERIDESALGAPFSICPGERVIEVSALDREAQTQSIRAAGTETKHLTIELHPRAAELRPPLVPLSDPGRPQRIAGLVVGALGLVGVGVTVPLIVNAIAKRDAYIGACPGGACPSIEVKTKLKGEAECSRDIAIATGVTGGALLAIGAILYGTAPTAHRGPSTTTVTLRVSPMGAVIEGRW